MVDGGNPFTPLAKTIAGGGIVREGPVESPASGYAVIKADSLDDAVEMAKGCPVLKGGTKIWVCQTFDARGK